MMNVFRLVSNTRLVALVCCLLFAAVAMHAQNGAITGTVKDNQGAVVPGAKVVVLDQVRAGQREMNSTSEGLFLFDSLPPSTYMVTVEAAGFRKWEKKDIILYPGDRLGVTDIVLQVGQISETVTVTASAATLQTESAKVEAVITSQQFTEESALTRNFVNLWRLIPGAAGVSAIDMYGGQANINGQRSEQMTTKIDGTLNMTMGAQGCCVSTPNMDMIEEMKVITNGATADMGQVGSTQVLVITKSGSKEFHGNVYYFQRREYLNANSWTNKINNVQKSRDRMNQGGFTLGGPVYIPKRFNTNKDKLFFFFSAEMWRNLSPNVTQATVPTQAERNGDFSKSIRMSDRSAVVLLDPNNLVNGVRQPVPSNNIASRINSDGRALMNIMPLPNVTDPTVQYNYQRVNSSNYSDFLQRSLKVDYNYSDKWRFYGRFGWDAIENGTTNGVGSFELNSAGQRMGWRAERRPGQNGVLNATAIITPTATNEIILGYLHAHTTGIVDKPEYTRTSLGLVNPLPDMSVLRNDLAPLVSLGGGGISYAPSLGSTWPYLSNSPDYTFTDNFTKVFSRHTFKAGIYYQRDRTDQDRWGGVPTNGSFSFSVDSVNPGDYDNTYANMLTGNFNTFTQSKKDPEGRFCFNQAEWWVMDTWKVRPNLTVDVGFRFSSYMGGSYYDTKGQSTTFSRNLWDPTKVVTLYGYAPGGKAVNPLTGLIYPGLLRGQIVPGSGNIDNGFSVTGKNGIPARLMPDQPIMVSPRLGIAWQPKFLPKTVIRVGGGFFRNRVSGNQGMDSVVAPPTTRDTVLRYGNMSAISSALYNVISPPDLSTRGYTGSGKIPETINWNFAVEKELPSAVLATVSYVGSISRNLPYSSQINEPAYGSAWLAANQDPTVTPKFDGTTTLPVNYYRPYPGIGTLNLYATGGSSNYNSLQVQVQKRLSRKLSYGLTYTWAKAMGIADSANPFDRYKYNYARLGFDRTQVFAANFVYYLPKFGKNGNLLDIPGVRLLLNDWQLSGIVIGQTGTPTQFNFPSFSNNGSNINLRWTGQPNLGPRPYVGNWRLPSDQMDDYHQFNTNAVLPANIPSVGLESGIAYWSNPATLLSSPEITMMKNVRFTKDGRRYVQLRLETYNALNHHDYNGRSLTPNFWSPTDLRITNLPAGVSTMVNPSTGAPLNGGRFGYGALTGAQSPRRVQLALKIYF